jgi:NTE family protein
MFPAGPRRDAILRDLRLTDGGVYDNLGLEPIWKDHAVVLVSDAGALFNFESDKNLFWRIRRYTKITENQARAGRKRWLISNFLAGELEGTYWGIGSAVTRYDRPAEDGYSKTLAREVIARIRTDMDAFSAAEAAVLENHGYTLADAAIQRHVPELLADAVPPLTIPHPTWMNERSVRDALRESRRRWILGRW